MSSRSLIERYLLDEGVEYHSSGAFSQDVVRQRQLKGMQFLDRGLWTLKAMQAAVNWGAHQFNLSQGRKQVKVEFFPTRVEAHEPWLRTDRGAAHLWSAAQIAATYPDESVEVSVTAAGEERSYRYAEGGFQFLRSQPQPGKKTKIQISRSWATPWYRLDARFHQIRQAHSETQLLTELGRYSPIRVLVDNRLLNDPVPHKAPGLNFVAVIDRDTPRPAFPYSAAEKAIYHPFSRDELMALVDLRLRQMAHVLPVTGPGGTGAHGYLQKWELQGASWEEVSSFRPEFSKFDSLLSGTWQRDRLEAICLQGYLSCDLNSEREGRLYIVQDGMILRPKLLPSALDRCLVLW